MGAATSPHRAASNSHYLDRIIKYIPAEVIMLYLVLTGLVAMMDGPMLWLEIVIFAIGIGAVILHLLVHRKMNNNDPISTVQVVISVCSFIIWVFALPGGFMSQFDWYQAAYGAMLLTVFSFVIAMVNPEPETTQSW